eukprot:1144977-Pelagomonas_calceolata.AAC.3
MGPSICSPRDLYHQSHCCQWGPAGGTQHSSRSHHNIAGGVRHACEQACATGCSAIRTDEHCPPI